ncbi:MAG: hypothetical protein CM1200mP2_38490 [Planctomycetaceae bacterium]|nr:MAG: hypothetical protein CM1200mP2_38490 [Planctomycetaceae bacterium]
MTGKRIAGIPLRTNQNGTVVTVGDVANIRDGFADIDTVAALDDRPVMSIKISMTADEDMLTIREQVADYVGARAMPPGYDLKTWDDYSKPARNRLDLLSRNGVYGLSWSSGAEPVPGSGAGLLGRPGNPGLGFRHLRGDAGRRSDTEHLLDVRLRDGPGDRRR